MRFHTHTVNNVLCIPRLCTEWLMTLIAVAQAVKNTSRGQHRMSAVAEMAFRSWTKNPPLVCEKGSTACMKDVSILTALASRF